MTGQHNQNAVSSRHTVVYHGPVCPDGFAAAYAAWLRFHDSAHYISCNYGAEQAKFVEHVRHRDVDEGYLYVLDFSFSREQLNLLATKFKRVVVLDHHKTAQDELQVCDDGNGYVWIRHPDLADNIDVHFDMSRSGCHLAWEYFGHGALVNDSIMGLIGMRDLWKHKGTAYEEAAEAVNMVITSQPFAFETFDDMFCDYDGTVNNGHALRAYFNQKVAEVIQGVHRARMYSVNGPAYVVINAPYFMASEVGSRLSTETAFVCIWSMGSNGQIYVSLRSKGDLDVAAIAKSHGGGGHKNAAGCSFPNYEEFAAAFMRNGDHQVTRQHPNP